MSKESLVPFVRAKQENCVDLSCEKGKVRKRCVSLFA